MAKWSVALFGYFKPNYYIMTKDLIPIKRIVAWGYNDEPYYADVDSFVGEGKGYAGLDYAMCTKDINKAAAIPQNVIVGQTVMQPEEKDGALRIPLYESHDKYFFATANYNFGKSYNDGQYLSWDADKHYVFVVDGNEKRAKPGDVIGYHPFDKAPWNEGIFAHYLVVALDGPDANQMQALKECQWDTTSYKIPKLNRGEQVGIYPAKHEQKRRFHIPLDDLEDLGVDMEQMLSPSLHYNPGLKIFSKVDAFDKLRDRYTLASDGLHTIQPLIVSGAI